MKIAIILKMHLKVMGTHHMYCFPFYHREKKIARLTTLNIASFGFTYRLISNKHTLILLRTFFVYLKKHKFDIYFKNK